MNVKLISVTPNAEKTIGYCARVSNPKNQDNPNVSKLLGFCIKHGHWSIFEMANMVVEIQTSRAIAQQILRHRSFSFQEFSQRYAEVTSHEETRPRRQDKKDRQNSIDDLPEDVIKWFAEKQMLINVTAQSFYKQALKWGIAKECARFLLPLNTQTTMYMNGTVRSWIHYIKLRTDPSTQKEHRDIANAVKYMFVEHFPATGEALGWNNGS